VKVWCVIFLRLDLDVKLQFESQRACLDYDEEVHLSRIIGKRGDMIGSETGSSPVFSYLVHHITFYWVEIFDLIGALLYYNLF
jgi:hypothetical protein